MVSRRMLDLLYRREITEADPIIPMRLCFATSLFYALLSFDCKDIADLSVYIHTWLPLSSPQGWLPLPRAPSITARSSLALCHLQVLVIPLFTAWEDATFDEGFTDLASTKAFITICCTC
ncbi:hypothetical protein C8R45DRAFT_1093668 [Mycena sanguinolenta]|nr:hypothetical protein C8R45DRAFT_1093668 [Mycena sanguinolenta]